MGDVRGFLKHGRQLYDSLVNFFEEQSVQVEGLPFGAALKQFGGGADRPEAMLGTLTRRINDPETSEALGFDARDSLLASAAFRMMRTAAATDVFAQHNPVLRRFMGNLGHRTSETAQKKLFPFIDHVSSRISGPERVDHLAERG